MHIDSSGNIFKEIKIPKGTIRASYIEQGWNDSPSIRIQIKDEKGHLRQGPEIPIENTGEVVSVLIELLVSSNQKQ